MWEFSTDRITLVNFKNNMYNCFNDALKYLQTKYGYVRGRFTTESLSLLSKARNKKEYAEIVNSFTDSSFELRTNPVTDEKDKTIELLMTQYYYGIPAKRELHITLIELGVIPKQV